MELEPGKLVVVDRQVVVGGAGEGGRIDRYVENPFKHRPQVFGRHGPAPKSAASLNSIVGASLVEVIAEKQYAFWKVQLFGF